MIPEVNCDILKSGAEIIAHCANCFWAQNSGVARAIRDVYPELYAEDCKTLYGQTNKLGTVSIAHFTKNIEAGLNPKFGANLYGQFTYGSEVRKLNYEAIYTALVALKEQMYQHNIKSVAFPYKMGCGLAGGDWRIVRTMIEVVFGDGAKEVIICKI